MKVSAATVTWPPPPKTEDEWFSQSAAYNNVFQDWRSWMLEGIVDINVPMVYSPHDNPGYHRLYTTWLDFAKEHRYNRHVVVAPALYLNSESGTMAQIREALAPGRSGRGADGVALYSYASYSTDTIQPDEFFSDLSYSSPRNGNAPEFATRVSPPEMPWKTKPTLGHLKGFIREVMRDKTNALDGVTIALTGAANRNTLSDATGFYGSVDLLPGKYIVTTTFNGYKSETKTCVVKKGKVTTVDFNFGKQ